jgi:hypothetical protein
MGTKARNYYIYTLSNPNQPFWKNLLNTIHLFVVSIKALLPESRQNAVLETVILLKVLREWKTTYSKWRRDQAGEHPPQLRKDVLPVKAEVFQGKMLRPFG